MSTPFENAELRAQQFTARILLYGNVARSVLQSEVLDEQTDELIRTGISGQRTAAIDLLRLRREVNKLFLTAGNLLQELDGVEA